MNFSRKSYAGLELQTSVYIVLGRVFGFRVI